MSGGRRKAGASAYSWLYAHPGTRRVIRTFVYAFLGVLLPGLLGFLTALLSWAESSGAEAFPDAWSLAYVSIAAIVAGSIALVNAVGIALENATGKKPLRADEE